MRAKENAHSRLFTSLAGRRELAQTHAKRAKEKVTIAGAGAGAGEEDEDLELKDENFWKKEVFTLEGLKVGVALAYLFWYFFLRQYI